MKHFFTAAFAGLISLGAQAQVTETRTATEVSTIEVKDGIEVVFTQSSAPALRVETNAPENFAAIVTESKNGLLKIYIKNTQNGTTAYTPARVYVAQQNIATFKAATGAIIKTSGEVVLPRASISLASGATFTGTLQVAGSCKIKAASGAGFRGRVTCRDFTGDVTGGAFIRLTGSCATADVFCSGGALQAGKFTCEKADIRAQHASSAFIYAGAYIKAEADASSAITYYGAPEHTELGTNSYAIKRDNYKLALN